MDTMTKSLSATAGGIYFYERPNSVAQASHDFLNVHYYAPFTDEDGKEYSSCTDYYHTNKLLALGAAKEAEEVHAQDTSEQTYLLTKKLETQFYNTPQWKVWEERKVGVMRKAIELKFSKNSMLLEALLLTRDKPLIEDHPSDAFWGGSLPESRNMMGKLLMEYRNFELQRRKVIPLEIDEDDKERDFQRVVNRKTSKIVESLMKDFLVKKIQQRGEKTPVKPGDEAKKLSGEELKEKAHRLMKKNPPLMYLTDKETGGLLSGAKYEYITKDEWLIKMNDSEDKHECFFIIAGEAYVFNAKFYLEVVREGTFFGIDGPLFQKRLYRVKAGDSLAVMKISSELLHEHLVKDSKFTLNIGRNMLLKQNLFEGLDKFKNYVRQLKSGYGFNREELMKFYKNMESALHPGCQSERLDVDAWLYAIRRLPNNITSTLVFFITTKCPEVMSHPDVAMPVKTSSRPRQMFQTIPGKCVAILRDLETDLFDLMTNLCIHIVESKKVLKKLKSPIVFRDLLFYRNDQDKVIETLKSTELTKEEIEGLGRIWPQMLGDNLSNIVMHYNDFSLSVLAPLSHLKLDATESWVKRLWFSVVDHLKLDPMVSCETIPDSDMTVDLLQGSRRAFLNIVSPFIYKYRDQITKWAAENPPKLITKHFNCEEDRLYANAYYYLKCHPEAEIERLELEKEFGLARIDETDLTGVTVTIVDIHKMKAEYCDPLVVPKPASKYHLLINIGYTFGVQSSDIIRAIMNIFGRKIRTISIIGKAGGLAGAKGDLMLATRIHSDESFEVVNNNLGGFNVQQLEKESGRKVHVGPMLTVAGTILQNYVLLNYYKKLCHCVGLEMEGLYFAREIKRFIELGLVREDIISRFAYYISDCPLDPSSTLSKEEGEISFDEGVPSLNAIYRRFINALFI